MKTSLRSLVTAAALAASVATTATFAGPAGAVDLGKLTAPEKGECVEITLGKGLLKFASAIARQHEPEAGKIIAGLSSVRVNVVGLDDTNRVVVGEQVKSVRERLGREGWEPIVNVIGKREENVVIHAKQTGDETIDGLVVTVIDERKKQAVLINIIGQIKAEQLAAVGEHLHLDHLKRAGQRDTQRESQREKI